MEAFLKERYCWIILPVHLKMDHAVGVSTSKARPLQSSSRTSALRSFLCSISDVDREFIRSALKNPTTSWITAADESAVKQCTSVETLTAEVGDLVNTGRADGDDDGHEGDGSSTAASTSDSAVRHQRSYVFMVGVVHQWEGVW